MAAVHTTRDPTYREVKDSGETWSRWICARLKGRKVNVFEVKETRDGTLITRYYEDSSE